MKPPLLLSRFTFHVSHLLLALGLLAFSGGPLSAQTPNIPELERLEAAHVKEVSEKVDGPFLAGLQRLNDSYRLTLEAALKKAVAAGELDETLAYQTESKRFAAEGKVPDQDEPGLHAGVAKLRTFVRAEGARLMKARATGLQPLDAAYLASLRALEKDLTRAQKIDEALAVRTRVNTLAAQAAAAPPASASPTAPVATPAGPAAQTPGLTVAPFARPVDKADLYVSGSNDLTVYQNNKEIVPNAGRNSAIKVRISIKEGDVLAILNHEGFDAISNWVSCLAPTGEFLFATSLAWKSYLPADASKWWDTKKVREEGPVEEAPDTQRYVDLIKAAASVTPAYHGVQPIRSTLNGDRTTYVMYTVTKADLLPKKVDPSLIVSLPANAAPFIGKTVRIATAKAGPQYIVLTGPDPVIAPYPATTLGRNNALLAHFKVGRGLQLGTVVFESVAQPGSYLRHENFQLRSVKSVNAGSCFYLRKPLAGTDGYSLSAQTHPSQCLMVTDQNGVALVHPSKMKDPEKAVFFLEPVPAK